MDVEMPEWPPRPYPPLVLMFGGSGPFEGRVFSGVQPAITGWENERTARQIARELAGDVFQPHRLAYRWQVPVFDPDRHVVIRYWLADNEIDIVAFYREYLPAAQEKLGRDPVFEVTNPRIDQEKAEGEGYGPTRRAVLRSDLPVLEEFAAGAERFEYELDQSVSWMRALDDSRWEARRQYEPQSSTWMSHRSWIMRTAGSGAATEVDRDPVHGFRFGPFMELFDDGTLWVWVMRRALPHLDQPIRINGVDVSLVPERVGVTCRMTGLVAPEEMDQVLAGVTRPQQVENSREDRIASEEAIVVQVPFYNRQGTPFWHPSRDLPTSFHRAAGSPLTVRIEGSKAEVRVWGNAALERGFELNHVRVPAMSAWNGGWRVEIPATDARAIVGMPAQEAPPPPPRPSNSVTEGCRVYSPQAVSDAIEEALGRDIRLFGRSASDSAIVALTRGGLETFLRESDADSRQYVWDRGGRNFDCENFSELLRTQLAAEYGVNGCAIIWGDGHAWCAVAVVGDDQAPEIVMVEPQSDSVVTRLTGAYAVERRAEVLL
ncbi:MAG: hypothetical protein F4121_09570 [Acidimicrobiia bacterium]|nr:hypothetical protein [Acidimicrobiia bacterium]